MIIKNIKKVLGISALGLFTVVGLSSVSNGQDIRKEERKRNERLQKQQEKIYKQQQKMVITTITRFTWLVTDTEFTVQDVTTTRMAKALNFSGKQ